MLWWFQKSPTLSNTVIWNYETNSEISWIKEDLFCTSYGEMCATHLKKNEITLQVYKSPKNYPKWLKIAKTSIFKKCSNIHDIWLTFIIIIKAQFCSFWITKIDYFPTEFLKNRSPWDLILPDLQNPYRHIFHHQIGYPPKHDLSMQSSLIEQKLKQRYYKSFVYIRSRVMSPNLGSGKNVGLCLIIFGFFPGASYWRGLRLSNHWATSIFGGLNQLVLSSQMFQGLSLF